MNYLDELFLQDHSKKDWVNIGNHEVVWVHMQVQYSSSPVASALTDSSRTRTPLTLTLKSPYPRQFFSPFSRVHIPLIATEVTYTQLLAGPDVPTCPELPRPPVPLLGQVRLAAMIPVACGRPDAEAETLASRRSKLAALVERAQAEGIVRCA